MCTRRLMSVFGSRHHLCTWKQTIRITPHCLGLAMQASTKGTKARLCWYTSPKCLAQCGSYVNYGSKTMRPVSLYHVAYILYYTNCFVQSSVDSSVVHIRLRKCLRYKKLFLCNSTLSLGPQGFRAFSTNYFSVTQE